MKEPVSSLFREPEGSPSAMLTRGYLTKLKLKALRRRVWFRAINNVERCLLNLVIRVVDRVRSSLLKRITLSIARKLLGAMESKVTRAMREFGLPFVQRLSQIAQEWGNSSAESWAGDQGFIQYWTVMYLNTPPIFRSLYR